MLGCKGLKALMQDKQHSQCLQVVALNRQLSYVVAWYFLSVSEQNHSSPKLPSSQFLNRANIHTTIEKLIFCVLQSDEDEDNYDEVRSAIEHSIIKERLTRLAAFGSTDSCPLSEDVFEEQAAAKEKVTCEAIHKRFNLSSCYLCKYGKTKEKGAGRRRSM